MKYKYFFVLPIILLLIGITSALGNTKDYNPETKEVIIKDNFGLPLISSELAKIKLTSNTYYCDDVCSATGTTTLYTRGKLMERLDFLKQSKTSWTAKTMPYQIYIQDGTEMQDRTDYIPNHDEKTNTTTYDKEIVKVEVPIWREYNNEDLEVGEYNWMIVGHKNYDETIDWQGTFAGVKVTDWSTWIGATTFNYRFNNSILDENRIYNFGNTTAITYAGGKVNQSALIPDGSVGWVMIGSTPMSNGVNWTIMTWLKPSQTWNSTIGAQNIIYDASDGAIGNTRILYDSQDGNLTCLGAGGLYATYATTFNASEFKNIACSYNGTTISLFINGTKVATKATTGYGSGTGPMQLSATAGTKSYYLDEFKFWNYTISDGTIQTIYNTEADVSSFVNSNLDLPSDGSSLTGNPVLFSVTSSSNLYNLRNITYYLWNSTGNVINKSTLYISGTSNSTYVYLSGLTLGNYNWNAKTCANSTTLGDNCTFASNYSFSWVPYVLNNEVYNNITTEGSNETFILNITYDSISYTLGNAYLIYDNHYYLANKNIIGGDTLLTKDLVIPSVISTGTQKQFYWNINFINSGNNYLNSTIHNQTINKGIYLFVNQTCSAGFSYAYNFSFLDEQNLTSLTANKVNYFISYGLTGNNTLNSANNSLNNISSFSICLNSTLGYSDIGYGELQYSIDNYVNRRYYIFSGTRATNQTIYIPLYDLDSSLSTSFLFTAQNSALQPYKNYYLSLLRWYPSSNSYSVVDMGKTDDRGQTVLKVKTEDVDYRVGLYRQDGTLIQLLSPIRMICQTTPCTYSVSVDPNPLDLTAFTNIQSSLTFDKSNSKFTFIWNDPSQSSQTMNLTVYQDGALGSEVICSDESRGYTGVLVCDVTGYAGRLRAEVYRTASPIVKFAQLIEEIKQTFIDVGGGSLGLFIGATIFIFMALIGIASPILVVIFGVVALIPLWLFGNISWAILMAIGVLAGVIIHFIGRTR